MAGGGAAKAQARAEPSRVRLVGAEGARGKHAPSDKGSCLMSLRTNRVVRGREKEGKEGRATGKRRQDKKGMDGPEPGT